MLWTPERGGIRRARFSSHARRPLPRKAREQARGICRVRAEADLLTADDTLAIEDRADVGAVEVATGFRW